MSNADKADFEIVGTVQSFYQDRGGKVARFRVRTRTPMREKTHDLKYFGTLPRLERGERVRVVGEPSAEKTGMTEQGRDGKTYDKWNTMLVALRVESLGKSQSAIPGTANDNARRPPGSDDDIPF